MDSIYARTGLTRNGDSLYACASPGIIPCYVHDCVELSLSLSFSISYCPSSYHSRSSMVIHVENECFNARSVST